MPPARRSEKNEESAEKQSDHVDDTAKPDFDKKQADRWIFMMNGKFNRFVPAFVRDKRDCMYFLPGKE